MQRAQARRAGQSRTHGAIRARQWDFPIPRLPAARAHSRCNSGDLGVHPGVWAVQRMRSDLSGPGKQPPLSSLGYTVSCFSPPARPPGGSPSKPVVGGGGRCVSSRHRQAHPPPLETSPPASALSAASAPLIGFIGWQSPKNGYPSRTSALGLLVLAERTVRGFAARYGGHPLPERYDTVLLD